MVRLRDLFLLLSSVTSLIVLIMLKELSIFQIVLLTVFIIFCWYGGKMIDDLKIKQKKEDNN